MVIYQEGINNFQGGEKIKILAANIRSLKSKLIDISDYIDSVNYVIHILIFNETWLDESEVKLYNIPNYNAHHNVRAKIGGGISIYYENTNENAFC